MSEYERMKQSGRMAGGPEQAVPGTSGALSVREGMGGTVREDYSADGNAWKYFLRTRPRGSSAGTGRFGGLSNLLQDTCLSLSLWNGKDPILRSACSASTASGQSRRDVRSTTGTDATPSHAWMRFRYHYPAGRIPVRGLAHQNAERDRTERSTNSSTPASSTRTGTGGRRRLRQGHPDGHQHPHHP